MKTWLLIAVLLIQIPYAFSFSQDLDWDLPEHRGLGEAAMPALIASGEILLTNGIFTFVNWLAGWHWAVPNAGSMQRNLTTAWQWETDDGFFVNQLGHPFQGSLYFSAGRANGFGFYQSLLFSAFGSAVWETFFENNHASMNDFVTTVTGSLAAGEMSYRLFVEAHAAGLPAPLAFLLNPVAGLHSLLTGWEPPPAERNIHELRIHLGAAYAETRSYIHSGSEQQEAFSFNGPYADAGFQVVYGNPFQAETWVPYRHFEFALSYGMNPGRYHDIRAISDGYLFSFSPIHTETSSMSTGLSMHMDFNYRGKFHIHDSTINQYSNALNWTVKHQRLFSHNAAMQIKGHAGFTFLGASKYYSPHTESQNLNNYGYGLNSKLFFSLEQRKLGRLEASLFGYALWAYPGVSALEQGTVYWLFSDITYSRFVSQHFSVGITGSLARERGFFGEFPDTRKRNDSAMFFAAWNL